MAETIRKMYASAGEKKKKVDKEYWKVPKPVRRTNKEPIDFSRTGKLPKPEEIGKSGTLRKPYGGGAKGPYEPLRRGKGPDITRSESDELKTIRERPKSRGNDIDRYWDLTRNRTSGPGGTPPKKLPAGIVEHFEHRMGGAHGELKDRHRRNRNSEFSDYHREQVSGKLGDFKVPKWMMPGEMKRSVKKGVKNTKEYLGL